MMLRMRNGIAWMMAVAIAAMLPPLAHAQQKSSGPAFEVASLRPSGPQSQRGAQGGPDSETPTRYQFDVATLHDLICVAWNVEQFQVTGATAMLDKQAFDLNARLPDEATQDEFRAMLRSLLVERFDLKVHTASREFETYQLVVAKSGFKLKEADPAAPSAGLPGYALASDWPNLPTSAETMGVRTADEKGTKVVRMKGQSQTIAELASTLPQVGGSGPDVQDATNLKGRYTFALQFTSSSSQPSAAPAGVPDLATALRDQLGLDLVHKKMAFDVIVVDAVNKMPTEN